MNAAQIRAWHVYPDPALLQQRVAQAIERVAAEAISSRGEFRIVLAGGTTPRTVYEHLCRCGVGWASWHVYFGDERCLPCDHAERNSVMAWQAWLGKVDIPPAQIHAIPAELGAEEAARQYSCLLEQIGMFDLVLLGVGQDGHTASLFPGRDPGFDSAGMPAIAVHDAPKPPSDRVSLSAWRLGRARQVWFLVTGADKADAVRAWRDGADLPAAAIVPEQEVNVWVDVAALD